MLKFYDSSRERSLKKRCNFSNLFLFVCNGNIGGYSHYFSIYLLRVLVELELLDDLELLPEERTELPDDLELLPEERNDLFDDLVLVPEDLNELPLDLEEPER